MLSSCLLPPSTTTPAPRRSYWSRSLNNPMQQRRYPPHNFERQTQMHMGCRLSKRSQWPCHFDHLHSGSSRYRQTTH